MRHGIDLSRNESISVCSITVSMMPSRIDIKKQGTREQDSFFTLGWRKSTLNALAPRSVECS
jgi:hypothetical protein